MDFQEYLQKSAKVIDQTTQKIFKEHLQVAQKTDKKLLPLLQAFIKSCQGGKGIRGVLVMLGYELEKQVTDKEIAKVGAAYEIIHSAILVHDDIIDKSPIRRDQASLYKALGDNHYGISQAISLADFGFFLALKILVQTNFPDRCKIMATEIFTQTMIETAWGEMLDLEKTNPLIVMKLKTARYTIAGPLRLGAILAGLSSVPKHKKLQEFGENLGVAYQIKDDLLDGDVKNEKAAAKEVEVYSNKALKLIPHLTKNPQMSKILKQMIEALINRQK